MMKDYLEQICYHNEAMTSHEIHEYAKNVMADIAAKDAEIAALKAEVERLREDKLLMRDVCEGQSGAISDLQRQAKIEVLREVWDGRGWPITHEAGYEVACDVHETLKQLEANDG